MDIVDPQTRSRMMSGIRGSNTRPELILRRGLHAAGLRFRLHVAGLPGRPDIVLARHGAVVFVHGCFWHRHRGCHWCTTPASRTEFWRAKFEANVARDQRNAELLRESGWRIATVWECALKVERNKTVDALVEWLRAGNDSLETDLVRLSGRMPRGE